MRLYIFSSITARTSFKYMCILVFRREKLRWMITYKLHCLFTRLSLIYRWVKGAGKLVTLFKALQAWISLRESMVHRFVLTHHSVWQNVIKGAVGIHSFIHRLVVVLHIMKILRMVPIVHWLRILITLWTEVLMCIDKHIGLVVSIHVHVRSLRGLVYLAVWLFYCIILSVLIVLHSILVVFVKVMIVLFFILIIFI